MSDSGSVSALEMLQTLRGWRSSGWLRALDLALAGFLHELDAHTPPGLLLAAAWLAQLEGQPGKYQPLLAAMDGLVAQQLAFSRAI